MNNFQSIKKVAAEPVPVLYSQTSAGTFSTVLPLQGNPDEVSNFNAVFTNYNTTLLGANWNATYNNSKYVSTSLTDEFELPVSASLWTVTSASRFGLSGSDAQIYINANTFLTSSTSTGNNPQDAFGLPGEVFFTRDPFSNTPGTNNPVQGGNNNLSSVYKYRMTVQIPSSVPSRFKYDDGGWNDSSDYTDDSDAPMHRRIIGDIKIYMQYNYGAGGTWSTVALDEITSPSITYYYAGGQQRTFDLRNMVGSQFCKFVNQGNGGYFHLEIYEKLMSQTVRNQGLEPRDALYVTYNFSFQNADSHIIKANRRYRYFSQRTYKQEPVQADRNYWNPVTTAQAFGGMVITPPVKGPFINADVVSDQSSGTQVDNAVNAPFWYFSQSNEIGPLQYNYTNSILDQNPGTGLGVISLNSTNPTTVTKINFGSNPYDGEQVDFTTADALNTNTITITDGANIAQFLKYNVTNWVNNSTYQTLTVTFNNSSSNYLDFSGTGSVLNSASVVFATGSTIPNDVQNTLLLSSSNANSAYANGYYQSYLPYTASLNPAFPGGFEPADADFPQYNIEWEVFPGDELRFENLESKVYTVQRVFPPSENVDAATQIGQLKLEFTTDIPPGINMDFFLLRRYRYSPNSIIVDKQFPYGGLPIVKEFVPSTNNSTKYFNELGNPTSSAQAYTASGVQSSSGSVVEVYAPLTIAANTPAGFLFPQYPTADIELDPDKIIVDLRDKKLIE